MHSWWWYIWHTKWNSIFWVGTKVGLFTFSFSWSTGRRLTIWGKLNLICCCISVSLDTSNDVLWNIMNGYLERSNFESKNILIKLESKQGIPQIFQISHVVFTYLTHIYLLVLYAINCVSSLRYYQKCYCPEGNEPDLYNPTSPLLKRLQELRRDYTTNNLKAKYSQGTFLQFPVTHSYIKRRPYYVCTFLDT